MARDLRTSFRVAIFLIAMISAGDAWAAACNVPPRPIQVTATNLNFGNYNAASPTANTANMAVTVRCVRAVDTLPAFVVSLSKGSSPTYTPRTMLFGANTLSYNIFNQAAFTTIWGDGTGGTATRSYGGGGNVATGTGYGRIPAGQYVAAGAYTDTITVTVTY
jgi:spore coat protein U-like protein